MSPPSGTKSFRVLHVLDHSLPLLSGYAVRSRSLIEAQRNIGFRPLVVTGPLHEIDDANSADMQLEGIQYLRTPIRGKWLRQVLAKRTPVIRELTIVRLLQNRISAILQSEQFDIVHAHSPSLCGMAAWAAARRHSVPFVYEIRAFWEDAAVDQKKTQVSSLRYRVSRGLEYFVARRAHAVVGIAAHILDELAERNLPRAKLFHVSNGVDASRFMPRARDQQLAAELGMGDEPVFAFFGSLYRYEGIPWLVRAAAELRRRGYRFRMLLAGNGEDRQAVIEAIDACRVNDCVHYLGQIAHDQITRYYSLTDILVYPRLSVRLTELVTPLKPLEAMAQGKSVLGSSVGGIRELVHDEDTGLIFRAEDIDDFCRQAARLLELPLLRDNLAERGRQYVLHEKDWNVLAAHYANVYEYAQARLRDGGRCDHDCAGK